jgi:hypothetical protein
MYNIAQVNIARMNAPTINDPIMADFVAQLDTINMLAETSKGFVWRLKEESGNATELSFNGDPRIIVNMSVWESIDDLVNFTYKTLHREVLSPNIVVRVEAKFPYCGRRAFSPRAPSERRTNSRSIYIQ